MPALPATMPPATRTGRTLRPRGRCHPADIALYFERPAWEAWEQPSTVSMALHGPELPVETPMSAWLIQAGSPPALPSKALQGKREGTFYLTSRRLLFAEGYNLVGLPLLPVAGCELPRDGLAIRAQGWKSRLVFLLNDPLPVALYVARALRAELLMR